ncbi:YjjG family noncanonical pyrimidine nucleotidase [Polaribacter staleyi]|uniref:YjjG family noncanonical pyrimidine nucleotidase n=1 Tax=Polaribacter staleyi TaxID=2022337 RepID=UPI0031BBBA4E
MKNIQHVFFDLDHTLWDFEKNSDLAFQKVFIKHSISLSLEDFLTVYKPLNFNYWKLYREEKVTKEQLRYGRLKDSFESLNYRVSDDLINEIAVNYLEFLPDFNYLFDGTFEILEYLKSKYQLHIITNGFEEVQTQKMLSSNIHHYFDKIITSESVGVKKPNPKVFNYALDLAKADKGNSIMIGDNLEADIEGAINVGMRAIYCNFENNTSSNNSVTSVTSLIEIKEYL